jgi:hypothetical protein
LAATAGMTAGSVRTLAAAMRVAIPVSIEIAV